MKKYQQALEIILSAVKVYDINLRNHNYMFIYRDKAGNTDYFETLFLASNFLHLTGVGFSSTKAMRGREFYDKCIANKLRVSDFRLPDNGTADMKLSILGSFMQLHMHVRAVGDYDRSKIYLNTDIIAGCMIGCMGFCKTDRCYYAPNTLLKETIGQVARESKPVIAIYSKMSREQKYSKLRFMAKTDAAAQALPASVTQRLSVNIENDFAPAQPVIDR